LAGASVRLDWTGTAIYLYGDATPGGYTITLDETQSNARPNAPGVLFSQAGLPYRPHSLVLKVISGTTSISNATITVGMGDVGLVPSFSFHGQICVTPCVCFKLDSYKPHHPN
jgi:hypothetical protein